MNNAKKCQNGFIAGQSRKFNYKAIQNLGKSVLESEKHFNSDQKVSNNTSWFI